MDSWRSTLSPWGVQPRPFTYVSHFFGLVAVLFVFVWTIYFRGGINFNSSNTNHIFNVHPALMLLGLVFLGGEAILAYKTVPGDKATRKVVHLSLHFSGFALGIVGIIAAFKYHNLNSIDNLYSLHSWFGLITIILFGLQWVVGFVTFFFPGLAQSSRTTILPWHVFFGLFVYGLVLTTSELGFLEKLTFLQQNSTIAKFSAEAIFVNVTGLIVVLFGLAVFIAAIVPDYQARSDHYSPIE
ncbi:hypothetical protein L7F22_042397 [Adiantum nelumboides]|nr:hypothetical protein [Adiantum nelumboides]